MRKDIGRGVVALAITIASLGVLATPASAAVLTGDITGGSVLLTNSSGTLSDMIPVADGVGDLGASCVSNVQITTGGGATSITTWNITAWAVVQRFKWGATWYVLVETRTGGQSGAVTGVTATTADLDAPAGSNLFLSFDLYTATDQSNTATSCAHGTTRACRFPNVSLLVSGVYNGDIHTPAASHTAVLDGTGALGSTVPPCSTPFSTYSAGTIDISGLTVHLT